MWNDEKIYNTARDVASRELRFIAIKEALIQMRNEDERGLEKAQRRIVELESFDAASKVTIEKMALHINAQGTRIAELEAQLAAALDTIERATWCEVCGLPAAHCRENHW